MDTDAPLPAKWLFMLPRDIGLFLRSARTDAAIAHTRRLEGSRAAFEQAYSAGRDPWASADQRYRYQAVKYRSLMSLLPKGRRFARALDLGSGVGVLSLALADVADDVLGLDIAQSAVDRATLRAGGRHGVRFAQGDASNLSRSLDGSFDLVVIADTIYYLDAVDDMSLKAMACRVADLLAPGGICLMANHFFFSGDRDSRLSRRIHDAFAWSPRLALVREHRRPFYLASLLAGVAAEPALSA
jgi:SAM-dependent methyltransferase